ncbi:MAG: O-antigen ligase family protein [Gammaproteobacteria bacterium]
MAGYETLRAVQSLWIVLIFIHECRRIRQFEIAAWAIVAGIFLQIIIGYIQFSIESDLGLQALGEAGSASTAGANQGVYGEQSEVYRVGGLLGHPNLLGAYLAAFLPIPMALLFGSFSKHKKFILATVSVLGIMLLLITLSRSGWISFFFAFNLLLFFSFFNPTLRGKYRGLKTSVVVSALALTLLTSGPIAKRLTQSDEGAFNFRIDWMITAIHMVQDKPIMGYGLNTFIYHLPNKTKYGGYQSLNRVFGQLWPVVHNTYLIIWSEQGSLGFLVFIGFHIGIIRTAIQNLRYPLNTHLYLINIGSLCGFLALMIDGIASFFIKVPSTGRSWWILIGLIMAIQQWNQREMSYRSSQK